MITNFKKTILISEDDAGRVGWGGFGGFSAASLCVAGTRGCEWAEAQGWSESWWQTAWIYPWKPRVESLRSHRCFHSGKYWRNREADGQIVYVLMVTQTERGVFFPFWKVSCCCTERTVEEPQSQKNDRSEGNSALQGSTKRCAWAQRSSALDLQSIQSSKLLSMQSVPHPALAR